MAEFDLRRISFAETRAIRQRVLRPHQTLDEVAADEPNPGYAVGAFADTRLIAVGMISPEAESGVWRLRGMATEPAARGQGAGSTVLDTLVRYATENGAARVWCNARTPALALYQRAGFRATSEEFHLPRIGPHRVMELVIGSAADAETPRA